MGGRLMGDRLMYDRPAGERPRGVSRLGRAVTAAALLAGAALAVAASPAAADDPSPSASPSGDSAAPTSAGTSFRTATEITQGQQATANASTGDYLYWSFPADSGQRPTVKATVKLPSTSRGGTQTWQVDVYDGLRRRQACQYGVQTRTAAQDATSVDLSCTLRTVRSWAEPWDDAPLPGTYYIRLTAVDLGSADLGQPANAQVQVDSKDMGGAAAVDGSLSQPVVPGIATTSQDSDGKKSAKLFSLKPDDGWASGWWSDRWVWTALGGVLAALAGIGGYALTRGSGRPHRLPPGA
ncbi:hypothetical protein AB0C59_11315 [Streptomyces sp. NPDC048664]|uniref:hypothetical protein n=1 Tax=Streptomyces sp. NPDC048664 TaxID=3154505 RepID=UPI003447865C